MAIMRGDDKWGASVKEVMEVLGKEVQAGSFLNVMCTTIQLIYPYISLYTYMTWIYLPGEIRKMHLCGSQPSETDPLINWCDTVVFVTVCVYIYIFIYIHGVV